MEEMGLKTHLFFLFLQTKQISIIMYRKIIFFLSFTFLTLSLISQNERVLTFCFDLPNTTCLATNTRVADVSLKLNNEKIFSKTLKVGERIEPISHSFPKSSLITLSAMVYRGFDFEQEKNSNSLKTFENMVVENLPDTIRISFVVDKENQYQYLYYSLDENTNKPYRIPALAQTLDGTLLAVSDHRPCWADIGFGEVDIKLRSSKDYLNWNEAMFIADGIGGEKNIFECGFGDAAIVADRESDEVLIMCVAGRQAFPSADAKNHNFMARIRSLDGGKTWNKPEDVTSMFMNVQGEYKPILPEIYSMFFASGKIIQSKIFKAKNSKYYRLYASLLTNSASGHDNYVVYSDDFGASWHLLGGVCVKGGDEAKVEELSDGSILISSRKPNGRFFNIFTFSNIAKAKGRWAEQVVSSEVKNGIKVGANSCNGELLLVRCIDKSNGKQCEVLLQSLPTKDNRSHVTIFFKKLKENEKYTPTTLAQDWQKGLEVSDRLSAYSTMILQKDGKIGFLYEEGPNDYCIVYSSFTIEQITNGLFGSLGKN